MNLKASTPAATQYASLGAGAFGSLGLKLSTHDPVSGASGFPVPTTFSNATPSEWGQLTNKSIVYHFSTKSENMDAFGPGSLMFSWRTPRKWEFKCSDKSLWVGDIFSVNEWLMQMAEPQNADKYHYLETAEQVLAEIRPIGVMKGAILAGSRERQTGTTILNNVVGQRASVVNLWGAKATEGTPLHMICKKVASSGSADMAWKFFPYAGQGPPVSALHWFPRGRPDDWSLGASMRIGLAMSSPTAHAEGNENLLDDPQRCKRLAGYAGGVDVCIGL